MINASSLSFWLHPEASPRFWGGAWAREISDARGGGCDSSGPRLSQDIVGFPVPFFGGWPDAGHAGGYKPVSERAGMHSWV